MSKVCSSIKIEYMHMYTDGKISMSQIARETGVTLGSVQQWIRNFKSMGEDAFLMVGNKKYSAELKLAAVHDYLSGLGSQQAICLKYGIRARRKLQEWIMKYNSHEELKTSGTGGARIMTKGRKTTFQERVDIVNYCIAHAHNYTETAEIFHVSYQQARNYTIKYETHGVEGLQDRRGKRKPENEMTELEKLRAENKILQAEKTKAEMEVSFLKKLAEIERRRG